MKKIFVRASVWQEEKQGWDAKTVFFSGSVAVPRFGREIRRTIEPWREIIEKELFLWAWNNWRIFLSCRKGFSGFNGIDKNVPFTTFRLMHFALIYEFKNASPSAIFCFVFFPFTVEHDPDCAFLVDWHTMPKLDQACLPSRFGRRRNKIKAKWKARSII